MEDNMQTNEGEESDSGEAHAVAIIPKQRDTPKKIDEVETPTPIVRGRGRPPKSGKSNVESDNNAKPSVPRGRGRPPKQGKLKIPHAIVATGRGRGRPKNPPKSDPDVAEADVDENVNDNKPIGRGIPKKGKEEQDKPVSKRGRPKKVQAEDIDVKEQKRPIGRPATGGGAKRGRPKKEQSDNRGLEQSNGDEVNKRGRPAKLKPKPLVEINNEYTSSDEESLESLNESISSGDDDLALAISVPN